ncbi:UNVERIFIED_CONTAM: hypothetical protein GTU68_013585 [Idotea baltica]|nr:hypothetical protein [Idotea baltica]
MSKILVTGGLGFIGSHTVVELQNEGFEVVIIDDLSNTTIDVLDRITSISNKKPLFEKLDLKNKSAIQQFFKKHQDINGVIHFAASKAVGESVEQPLKYYHNNISTLIYLLEEMRENKVANFIFSSSCTVYGQADKMPITESAPFKTAESPYGKTGLFVETTPYDPQSPYAASKAASDHVVRSFGNTYKLPYVISNCSNNYGANQFPEKLIPLFIHNIRTGKDLPVYGDGNYTRDWLFVEDHAKAIDLIFHKGKLADTYNIGGFNEWTNLNLIKVLCEQMDSKLNKPKGTAAKLITFVKDRAGHDKRYAIDATKLNKELGWKPSVTFEEGLSKTIDWYLDNEQWLTNVTSGAYKDYYKKMYN